MKKFLATLFVILVLSGTVFFFGWAQAGVPPDAYGVIRSRTHGVDPELIRPGEFRWLWYRLIPGNTKTTAFRLNTVRHDFSAKNMLPSARIYSDFHGAEGNFSWEINAAFSFNIHREALVSLVTSRNITTQEELSLLERDFADQIEAFIIRTIILEGGDESRIEELLVDGRSAELEAEIAQRFPAIANFSLRVRAVNIPDFALYRQFRSLYEYFLARQGEFLSEILPERARDRVEFMHRLDELSRYGALFTRYPILLDFLALE